MANSTSGLFESLVVPASVQAAESLQYTKAALGSIFWDYKASGGQIGQTMTVNIPTVSQSDAVDIAAGPLQPSDTTHIPVPIVLDKHPSVSFVIKNWDDIRTPTDLFTLYLQPKLEALLRQCNSYVTGMLTSANFNIHAAVTSGAANTFQRGDLTKMWGLLAGAGVPVYQPGNLTFLTHPSVYANMLADEKFFVANVVGDAAAIEAQQRGSLVPTLNAALKFDQQSPIVSSKYVGMFLHRWAIAGVCAPPQSNGELGDVQETMIYPVADAPNFAVQVQMAYSLRDQGTLINLHSYLGFKTVRPDFGVYGATV